MKHYDQPVFVPKGYIGERDLNLYRGDAVKAIDGDWSLFRGTYSRTYATAMRLSLPS